jgi:DNA-binding LacI/PurR family transcriptional regulator
VVNQRDVAKIAGVSSATISRYINNKGFISEGLKDRIAKAIEELCYRPNLVARSLKMRSSKTIGLIFPDVENTFFIGLIKKAEETAFDEGYNIILCNTGNDPEKEKLYLDVLKGKLIDGYIIITSFKDKNYLEKALESEKVVFLDRSIGINDETVIKLDNIKGAKLAVEYLTSLGHNKIGFVDVTTSISPGYERYEGYKLGLKQANIKLNKNFVKFSGFTIENGYKATLELFSQNDKPTALIPISNRLTIGTIKALKELNLKIPDDISIVAFDDLKTAELLSSPLTVISQPTYKFGEVGIKTLIKKINGKELKGKTIYFEPKLIIRESCKRI